MAAHDQGDRSSPKQPDGLEAVKTIYEALKDYDPALQERVLRWAREMLGMDSAPVRPVGVTPTVVPQAETGPVRDIKTFVAQKKPSSDNQFAAVVAYYYRFEAPSAQRKDSLTADDLQEATRLVDRSRLRRPIETLHGAYRLGLLDKAGRGRFSINTVGENLVAMTLPQKGATPAPSAPARRSHKAKAKSKP